MIRRTPWAVVALAAALLAAAPAPAGTAASSIALDQAAPRLGEYVTFTVTYPNQVKSPRIAVRCYQNGALVYAEAGPVGWAFLLGGAWSDWKVTEGPADCTAELFYFKVIQSQEVEIALAWTSFSASG